MYGNEGVDGYELETMKKSQTHAFLSYLITTPIACPIQAYIR